MLCATSLVTLKKRFRISLCRVRWANEGCLHNTFEVDERPEDLYQRLMSFIEDSLLTANGSLEHHGEVPATDEEMSPTLENVVVLTWLRLINPELPALLKQRYGTELRSRTLASLKPEISQALDSLLEEIRSSADSKILRASASRFRQISQTRPSSSQQATPRRKGRSCPLCKQAGRNDRHFHIFKAIVKIFSFCLV